MSEIARRQRIAAYADVRDAAGRILLARGIPRVGARWFLPGGGLEFGEHPFDTVQREVVEETGLAVTEVSLREVVSDITELPDTTLHTIRFIYTAVVADQAASIRPEVGGSTDFAAWFAAEEVGDLELAAFVEAYLTRLRGRSDGANR